MRRLTAACAAVVLASVASVVDADATPVRPSGASGSPVAASCTISKAAFPAVRLSTTAPAGHRPAAERYAALTTARGRQWVGYAFQQFPHAVALISWRPGHAHAGVLARYGRRFPAADRIHVAGITPHGAVVHSLVKGTSGHRFASYAAAHGHLRPLAQRAGWASVYASTVTPSGAIYGTARTRTGGHTRYYLVRWATYRSAPAVIARVPYGETNLFVDTAGDAAWFGTDGHSRVRLTSGAVRDLGEPDGNQVVVRDAAGRAVYGESVAGTYRYDLTRVPSAGAIAPTSLGRGKGVDNWITSVSARGDLVTGIRSQLLRTASGKVFALPRAEADSPADAQGFDDRGVFAFTSARDGRPHFVRCH